MPKQVKFCEVWKHFISMLFHRTHRGRDETEKQCPPSKHQCKSDGDRQRQYGSMKLQMTHPLPVPVSPLRLHSQATTLNRHL